MKERPILFSTEMVKAILDGRKTMTRRVIKPQPEYTECSYTVRLRSKCPYGVIGDRLWVRETYFPNEGQTPNIIYKADWNDRHETGIIFACAWKPSIFMPRKYSRITLEITNIRVERVQEISEEEAKKEGVGDPYDYQDGDYYDVLDFDGVEINKCAFAGLWDSINGKKYPWTKNPYVFVIGTKKI